MRSDNAEGSDINLGKTSFEDDKANGDEAEGVKINMIRSPSWGEKENIEEKEIMDGDDDIHVLKAWGNYINETEEIMKDVIL
eukprot:4666996-Ditylum_brightwellii.AAC.1